MTRENYEKATQDYKNIEKNERVINLLKKATEVWNRRVDNAK